MKKIPVIDLFAGPGGLNHGFSSFRSSNITFNVKLSIEKDETAWRTLHLRAFLRQFQRTPIDYYRYIRGEEGFDRKHLKKKYASQWKAAEAEARMWTLGRKRFATITAAISEAIGETDKWVLLGGPPCQAYSIAGRSRMKNRKRFSKDKRHRLYREYLKIVAVHQPAVFVMENVKGILSSTHGTQGDAASIFHQIVQDLQNPAEAVNGDKDTVPHLPKPSKRHTYTIYSFVQTAPSPEMLKPGDFVIKSEDWGVPQNRHRVIVLGVRSDISVTPNALGEFFKRKTTKIEEVIGAMPKLRSRLSTSEDAPESWLKAVHAVSRETVLSGIDDVKIRKKIKRDLKKLYALTETGGRYIKCDKKPRKLASWLWDESLDGVIQHEARRHMSSDLERYFFAASAAQQRKTTVKLREWPPALMPDHKNAVRGANSRNEKQKRFDFEDRFRVQVKGRPATTITSHIMKDGHYYIHYDPLQCRSLTVREAARLQTFPDSYFFEGTRSQQYQQVGNAVPPLLAVKLARVVADVIRRSARKKA